MEEIIINPNNNNNNNNNYHEFILTTFSSPTYCNECEGLLWGMLNQGMQCIYCKYIVHEKECMLRSNEYQMCKPYGLNDGQTITQHHWVKGNIRTVPKCNVCYSRIGNGPTKTTIGNDYTCSICSLKVHELCISGTPKNCNGGSRAKFMVLSFSFFFFAPFFYHPPVFEVFWSIKHLFLPLSIPSPELHKERKYSRV